MLLPLFSIADSDTIHRVVNGEEVYEPPKDDKKPNGLPQNKKEMPKDKTPEKGKSNDTNMKDKETKNKMDEGKSKETQEVKPPMKEEMNHDEKSMEPKKVMDNSSSERMNKYKANKVVTSDEEDPYEIHKPIGIFWFFGVFVILLIVIFVFT